MMYSRQLQRKFLLKQIIKIGIKNFGKKTLKAKADDSKRTMNKIFKTIEEEKLTTNPLDFDIDEYSENIRTLEKKFGIPSKRS